MAACPWRIALTRLNHDRPQLRVLDNLRRELGRLPSIGGQPEVDPQWPAFLRPVAANPKAGRALMGVLEGLSNWLDVDAVFSMTDPPAPMRTAARGFAKTIIGSRYDPAFSGRDWLVSVSRDETVESREFWAWMLTIVDMG